MEKVKLFFCGDVAIQTGNSFSICDNLKREIGDCNYAICNFEGPLVNSKSKKSLKSGPYIGQIPEAVSVLKDVGFNIFSLANNHILDFGETAIKETIASIEMNQCYHVGVGNNYTNSYEPLIINAKGISVCIFSAGENEFGCNYEEGANYGFGWLFSESLEKQIIKYKEECDFLILNAHAGVENIEFPLLEWQCRYKVLCDLGINIIIGHHPHVPQGIETYNKSIIFYSLGNFHFVTENSTVTSLQSFSVNIEIDDNKTFKYNLIYHVNENGKVKLVDKDEVNFDILQLSSLCNENLIKLNENKAVEVFYSYYEDYYRIAMGAPKSKRSLWNDIKFLVKFILRKRKLNSSQLLLLLHNIKIDSHRFIVQRALNLLVNQKR
jgi:poly-gamma-glutamate synthesis protein (capsule biosynthesis protein)